MESSEPLLSLIKKVLPLCRTEQGDRHYNSPEAFTAIIRAVKDLETGGPNKLVKQKYQSMKKMTINIMLNGQIKENFLLTLGIR